MEKRQKKSIEIFAKDDARWDGCFAAVNRTGIVKNHTITVYDPPKDADENKIYDHAWKKAKREK
jgi:hypothetical protein